MRQVARLVLVALAGWGCGGSVDGGPGGFATTPDASVLTPAVVRVTLTSKGGGLGGGSDASRTGWVVSPYSYTLSLDTKRLAFTGWFIQGDGPGPPVSTMDDVNLTDPEFQTLVAAARAVTVSARRGCGADASERELRVESAGAALTYGDDFYGCLTTYEDFVTFDGLNNLETAFAAIGP
jgi:hypothetical protein